MPSSRASRRWRELGVEIHTCEGVRMSSVLVGRAHVARRAARQAQGQGSGSRPWAERLAAATYPASHSEVVGRVLADAGGDGVAARRVGRGPSKVVVLVGGPAITQTLLQLGRAAPALARAAELEEGGGG